MMTKEDEKEIEAYEEFEKEYLERVELQRRKIDFTKGIALGLLYGIIGNLFVQFFYPVFEGVILEKYDVLFWSNLVISAIALGIILLVTFSFRNQLSWSGLVMEGEKEGARHLKGIINEKKAKLRNKTESSTVD